MTITPLSPSALGTVLPSAPTSGNLAPQNSEVFSPVSSLDQFMTSSGSGSINLRPSTSNLETLNFIEGICQEFTIPKDVKIPDRKIISIFSTIAAENALPIQPGNTYTVFEDAGQLCNLENAARTLAANGTVHIKTAKYSERNELLMNPPQTIKSFADLIQWDAL